MGYSRCLNISTQLAGILFIVTLTLKPQLLMAGEHLSAVEIVEKANCTAYYQGKDGRARTSMVITDDQGRKRRRTLTILRRDSEDGKCTDQQYYVYFHRPADLNKMVFMVWKNPGRTDDRWLYLPALDLVKRIAASDKRTSFVGSHFFYEDVSGRSTNEDGHTITETNDTYYVIKSTPKKPDTVEFSSYTTWVHKSTFLPVKAEYLNKNKRLYRSFEALKVEMVGQYPTIMSARMNDLERGGSTTVKYSRVAYNNGYPSKIFTERYLRTPPKKYLR